MAASFELNSFIGKFHQLWNAGYSAHLDISSNAGQAWVGLRVQLGYSSFENNEFYPPPPPGRICGPSWLRRRSRRATAAAQAAATRSAEEATANANVEQDSFNNISPGPTEEVAPVVVSNEDIAVQEIPTVTLISNENECHAAIEAEITCVECIATLDSCPDEVLDKGYADSLRSFLFEEQHLRENVYSSKFNHLSSRSFRNEKYVYTISITLKVKKSRLQDETPISYTKKHPGQKTQTMDNGTKVKLSRIHKQR